jgi:TetR/AcrR family transcriptional regulator
MPKTETRIQKKNQATILAAGLEVFSKYGFRGSTLDMIADVAGMSKPNLLYYFSSKNAIYKTLLAQLLENWMEPVYAIDPKGDPVEEILRYAQLKLKKIREFPRESRLFANEIIQGAPQIGDVLNGELRHAVEELNVVVSGWIEADRIRPVDTFHLVFSIWSLTQHYADFDVQVRAVMGDTDPFVGAEKHLEDMIRQLLTP